MTYQHKEQGAQHGWTHIMNALQVIHVIQMKKNLIEDHQRNQKEEMTDQGQEIEQEIEAQY